MRISIQKYLVLRRELLRDLGDSIEQAEARGWEASAVSRIKTDVRSLFGQGHRISLILIAAAVVPFAIVVALVVNHSAGAPYSGWYRILGVWAMVVGLAALYLLWPTVSIMRTIRRLPTPTYRELVQVVWLSFDLLNIAVNASLLLYVILSLSFGKESPVVFILAILWLFGPLVLFVLRLDMPFLFVRGLQMVVVLLAAAVAAIVPLPVKQYEWATQLKIAKSLRVADQQEVTERWAQLNWFSPEGLPLVWYSQRAGSDYHLFTMPGTDPETNVELVEVRDSSTKEMILRGFRDKQERAGRIESEKRAAAKNEETLRQTKSANEERKQTISNYVYPDIASSASTKNSTVLVVLEEGGIENTALSKRVSKKITESAFPTSYSIFKPAFFETGQFKNLVVGKASSEPVPLSEYAARILLVRHKEIRAPSPAATGEQLVAIAVTLDVKCIDTNTGREEYSSSVSGKGVGFKESTAAANALNLAESSLIKFLKDNGGK